MEMELLALGLVTAIGIGIIRQIRKRHEEARQRKWDAIYKRQSEIIKESRERRNGNDRTNHTSKP